jgi:hypothetical protein
MKNAEHTNTAAVASASQSAGVYYAKASTNHQLITTSS